MKPHPGDASKETTRATVTLVHQHGELRELAIVEKRGGVVSVAWPLVGTLRFSSMSGHSLAARYRAWRLSEADVKHFRKEALRWRQIYANKAGCGS